jgi:hypothetical protein
VAGDEIGVARGRRIVAGANPHHPLALLARAALAETEAHAEHVRRVLDRHRVALPYIEVDGDRRLPGRRGGEWVDGRHAELVGELLRGVPLVLVERLALEVEVLLDHHVEAVDQAAPHSREPVGGSRGAPVDREVVLLTRPLDAEAVVAVRHAVAHVPLEERPDLEPASVLELVPVGVHDRHALLEADAHVTLQCFEPVLADGRHSLS